MAKGRELKTRIKSVENTRKITKTMEMVATSKMKRAQDRVSAARPYADALRDVIANLYTPELAEKFPLLRQPAQVKRAAVIALTRVSALGVEEQRVNVILELDDPRDAWLALGDGYRVEVKIGFEYEV